MPMTRSTRSFLVLLVAAAASVATMPAQSAITVCVTTAAQLDAELHAWDTTQADLYTIKVHQGSYALPASGGAYSAENSGASLRLLGGYTDYGGDACGKRQLDAANTVVYGNPANPDNGFGLFGYAPELTVSGMTFKSFGNVVEFDTRGTTTISGIVVTDVHGNGGQAALQMQPSGGYRITLQNSLVYGNPAPAAILAGDGFADDSTTIVLLNDTIAQNGGAGVIVGTPARPTDAQVVGYNNIVWGNADVGLRTDHANSPPTFIDTIVDTSSGAFSAGGLYSHADPKFLAPGASPPDLSLQTNSPAVNAGAAEFLVGSYSSTDVRGHARVVGSAIDLGAYESAVDDLAPQTVTNTLDDNSAGTLRSAITAANGNADATTIRFNAAGACPRVITLASLLPDITSDVTIDGYTQSGAAANADGASFDAAICVVLRGNLDHALRVSGAGRLTVRGVEFEGFTNAAVRISAGSGSQVLGNAFAAFPASAANSDGVLIEGSAKNAVVGGTDPPSHNVFDQATNAAIEINGNGVAGGHAVIGNYIGFALDGSNWAGSKNLDGIALVGSGGNRIESNVIGNSANFGILLTTPNATGNAIEFNTIGLAPFTRAPAGNGNAGIALANGAHDNRVGPAAGSTAGAFNEIRNNAGPGIWLEGAVPSGAAGNNNRITGANFIYGNSGLLAIDLGAAADTFGLGPTANDTQDADTGPNRVENYPYLTQAMRFEADRIALDGYLIPEYQANGQTYRLDVFWTDACVGSGANNDTPRGEMKRYVGNVSVAVSAYTFFKTFPYTTLTAPRSIPGTGFLFATATDANGNTSEPGPCETFVDDYIFSDPFGR